jgi:uncharacterized protein YndB with AHSA1/START domain
MKDGTLSEVGGRYELRFVRPLSHPVGKVWEAITSPEGLRAWFPFDIEGERATGAPLRFVFREEQGGDFTGEMVEFTPPSVMELRWEQDETLRLELAPSEIDEEFAKLELEPVTTRQPGATNTGLKLVEMGANRVIVIEYSRKGLMGPETVRQYSVPLGKHLYRIVCSAPTASFGKHEPVFTAIVESFKVAAATS